MHLKKTQFKKTPIKTIKKKTLANYTRTEDKKKPNQLSPLPNISSLGLF